MKVTKKNAHYLRTLAFNKRHLRPGDFTQAEKALKGTNLGLRPTNWNVSSKGNKPLTPKNNYFHALKGNNWSSPRYYFNSHNY